jgi:hypothetical protein
MNKTSLKRLIGTVTAAAALAPYAALAQFGGAVNKLDTVAGQGGAGYDTKADLLARIGTYIQVVIDFSGIVLLGLTIYAGYTWMTAQGDSKKVTEAKGVLTNAIIGLVIVALAYAITAFVFNRLGAPQ